MMRSTLGWHTSTLIMIHHWKHIKLYLLVNVLATIWLLALLLRKALNGNFLSAVALFLLFTLKAPGHTALSRNRKIASLMLTPAFCVVLLPKALYGNFSVGLQACDNCLVAIELHCPATTGSPEASLDATMFCL